MKKAQHPPFLAFYDALTKLLKFHRGYPYALVLFER